MSAVLDSYALLAYLWGEPGAIPVRTRFDHALRDSRSLLMCEVNYAEVQYRVRRKKGDAAWPPVLDLLDSLPIEFIPADRPLADLAAGYKANHKMSLADAFAAALAKREGLTLMTGDPEFKPLTKEIKIEWL